MKMVKFNIIPEKDPTHEGIKSKLKKKLNRFKKTDSEIAGFRFSLKPNIQRIFLSAILILIFFFFPLIPVKNQIQCIRAPCNPIDSKIAVFQIFSQNIILTSMSWMVIFAGIITAYILACFLTTKIGEVY